MLRWTIVLTPLIDWVFEVFLLKTWRILLMAYEHSKYIMDSLLILESRRYARVGRYRLRGYSLYLTPFMPSMLILISNTISSHSIIISCNLLHDYVSRTFLPCVHIFKSYMEKGNHQNGWHPLLLWLGQAGLHLFMIII